MLVLRPMYRPRLMTTARNKPTSSLRMGTQTMSQQRVVVVFMSALLVVGLMPVNIAEARERTKRVHRPTRDVSSNARRHAVTRGSDRHYSHRSARTRATTRRATPSRRVAPTRRIAPSRRVTPPRRVSPSTRVTPSRRISSPRRTVSRPSATRRSVVRSGDSRRYIANRGTVRHDRRVVTRPSTRVIKRGNHVVNYPRHRTHITRHHPSRNRVIVRSGHRYHIRDRHYYRPHRHNVVVVRPRIGTYFDVLPRGYISLRIGGRHYYHCHDTYYVRTYVDNRPRYVVVEPPVEALIPTLPIDYEIIEYAGRTYYIDIHEEIAYIAVEIDGEIYYQETDLDVDVDIDDGQIEIEIDD